MEMAQVGVKTRARAALAMGAASSAAKTPKRRKINRSSNEELKFSPTSSFFQLNSRKMSRSSRAVVPKPETTTLLPEAETEERCSSHTSDEFPASCCSSNGSIGLDGERIKVLDLEVESAQVETSTCNCGDEIERREMSPSRELRASSQELESVEADSRRLVSTAQNMPTESELDEFFAAAEKDIQKRFEEKYNYDIVKDVPLEGRFEWVQLKP